MAGTGVTLRDWARQLVRVAPAPVAWPRMALAALAVGVPLSIGIAVGHPIQAMLTSMGGVVATLVDRPAQNLVRMRGIAAAAVLGSVPGLLIGTAVHGRGWVAVVVMVAVAGLSAVVSSISLTGSATGLQLLVFASLAIGPLGALRPWWATPLWLLVGVGWTLLVLAVDSLRHSVVSAPRAEGAGQVRRALASMLTARSTSFAIRLMLCIGLATVFSEVLPLNRSYWVPLAVAVVMKPDFGSISVRAVQYGAGTALGAGAAMLVLLAGPTPSVLVAPIVVLAALIPYGLSRNYALFGAVFTPLIVLILDVVSRSGWRIGEDRLVDILVGCGIVLVLGSLPYPTTLAMPTHTERGDARATTGRSRPDKRTLARRYEQ